MKEKLPNSLKSKFQTEEKILQDNSPSGIKPKYKIKGSHYFGIERGNKFVKRFKLIFRTGQIVSIPYAYLPIIINTPGRDLQIKMNDLEVVITGRGLNFLEEWLNEEKVLWIKESNTSIDEGKGEVYISNIKADGKNIQ
ncbi:MAG: hypothetical protein P1U70_06170 [Saprospiraceae bacterium]|jgi:hypothetical protein|nr:hypothetical protein [Saprospiraceae bacterium]